MGKETEGQTKIVTHEQFHAGYKIRLGDGRYGEIQTIDAKYKLVRREGYDRFVVEEPS